jgi:oligosaccharide repeat unit polymerase
MDIYPFLTWGLVIACACYVYFSARRDLFLNPVTYFFFFQIISFLGTIPLLNMVEEVNQVYYFCFFLGILSSLIGFMIGDFIFPVQYQTIKNWQNKPFIIEGGITFNFGIKALIVFSAVVCAAYFYAVGYNVFVLGFTNLMSGTGGDEDLSTMRLKSYNSDITGDYYYPGFVNQFKDTLFPLCMFYLWAKTLVDNKHKESYLFLVIFTLFSTVSVMGTGQRGAFALAMMMGCAFMFNILTKEKRRKFLLFSGIPAFGLFMVSTFLNGRTKSDKFEVAATLESIWERIASDNQWGSYMGFRDLMYPNGIQWGAEWWQGILGISPWHTGSTLANDIAGILWGGFGNAPPSSWGSIYYNFGFWGIFLYPLVTCTLIKFFYYRFYQKEKYLFRIQIYVYCYLLYGTWIGASPIEYYMNVGIMTLVILKYLFDFSIFLFGSKVKRLPMKHI